MKNRILVLGQGSVGSSSPLLSESLGDSVETTLIDRNDAFVFGFSKRDLMFGHATPEVIVDHGQRDQQCQRGGWQRGGHEQHRAAASSSFNPSAISI